MALDVKPIKHRRSHVQSRRRLPLEKEGASDLGCDFVKGVARYSCHAPVVSESRSAVELCCLVLRACGKNRSSEGVNNGTAA